MNVFFDPYWDQVTTDADPGPVQIQPALSVDDKGQITLAFATGDQQNLTFVDKQKNYVASVTETVATVASVKQFNSLLNWRHELTGGEHVVGPLALFDRYVYYSSYRPGAQSKVQACQAGTNYLHGEHYLLPDTNGAGPTKDGGLAAVGFTTPIASIDGVITGANIRQMPSCATGVTPDSPSTDAFLGYGNTTTVTSVTPGKFEVFFQKSGAQPLTQGDKKTIAVGTANITPPRTPVRIDSWAPIIE
jgi:hypothetical protein